MDPSFSLPHAFAPAERASTDDLRRQHNYFFDLLLRQALDAVPDIVMVLNQQRQIVFANRTLIDLLGCADDTALCGLRPGDALGCQHADESEDGCGTTEFCKTCGAARAILTSLQKQEAVEECRIIRKTGEALDLRVWATPLSLHDENFSILSVKDISHEKRRQVLERLFFHDLLNAAGGLQGFAELLAEASVAELDQIKGGISRLANRLVEEIKTQRELLAAESNELVVQPALIDTVKFLQELILMYQSHPVATGRKLDLAPLAQRVEFASDPVLLGRVIGNLIKNALEASQPGETVTLDCAAQADFVEFSIHNPTFIPRSIQLQLFQRSFSTRGTGRGLGTYSVRLLTERYLQGQVSFTSSPAAGTTFTLHYPRALAG